MYIQNFSLSWSITVVVVVVANVAEVSLSKFLLLLHLVETSLKTGTGVAETDSTETRVATEATITAQTAQTNGAGGDHATTETVVAETAQTEAKTLAAQTLSSEKREINLL